MSAEARYNRRVSGFTFIELIIVVAVLGILIPITATLVINSYSYYSNILNMNKLSLSADNALRSITNDIRLMEEFQRADDDNLYFTLADGEDRYYRFDSETFQMCKDNCFAGGNPVPENFGVLATNVNVSESSFKYYTELNEDDPLILGDNNVALGDQDFEDPIDPPVIFIKVEFQLDWDNMELPFMTIVRPGIPS